MEAPEACCWCLALPAHLVSTIKFLSCVRALCRFDQGTVKGRAISQSKHDFVSKKLTLPFLVSRSALSTEHGQKIGLSTVLPFEQQCTPSKNLHLTSSIQYLLVTLQRLRQQKAFLQTDLKVPHRPGLLATLTIARVLATLAADREPRLLLLAKASADVATNHNRMYNNLYHDALQTIFSNGGLYQ